MICISYLKMSFKEGQICNSCTTSFSLHTIKGVWSRGVSFTGRGSDGTSLERSTGVGVATGGFIVVSRSTPPKEYLRATKVRRKDYLMETI